MKQFSKLSSQPIRLLAVATALSVLCPFFIRARPVEDSAKVAAASADVKEPHTDPFDGSRDKPSPAKDGWLGVSTVEASESLAAQLKLPTGVGLEIISVVTNSPAANAGLKKHDVLTRLDDQPLVLPAQLRKLIKVHTEGDSVKLAFFRGGREEAVSVKLGRTSQHAAWDASPHGFEMYLDHFKSLLGDGSGDKLRLNDQTKTLRDSLSGLKLDGQIRDSIRQGLEQAHEALRDALRNTTNLDAALLPLHKALGDLSRSKVERENDSSVTVRSSSKGIKSLVKVDESGSIVLLSHPKAHLTAHDENGKLLFDGEIETPAQREVVPRELWERVEPLLEKLQLSQLEELHSRGK